MVNPTTYISIFKTSIENESMSFKLISLLLEKCFHIKVSFDLDDCDRILRIESLEPISEITLIELAKEIKVDLEVLDN